MPSAFEATDPFFASAYPGEATFRHPHSYRDIVHHSDPTAAYEAVANDFDDDTIVNEMLRQVEHRVADAAKDLEIGLRTKQEKAVFEAALEDYSTFMREMLRFEITTAIEDVDKDKAIDDAKRRVIDSHRVIIDQEGKQRLAHSRVERTKRVMAANRLSRMTVRGIIELGQVAVPGVIASVAYDQVSSEAASSNVLNHLEAGQVVGAGVSLGFAFVRVLTRTGVAEGLERLRRAFDYMPNKIAPKDLKEPTVVRQAETELLYVSQKIRHAKHTDHVNSFILGEEMVHRNPCEDVFIDGLIRVVVKSLRTAYLGENDATAHENARQTVLRSAAEATGRALGIEADLAKGLAAVVVPKHPGE